MSSPHVSLPGPACRRLIPSTLTVAAVLLAGPAVAQDAAPPTTTPPTGVDATGSKDADADAAPALLTLDMNEAMADGVARLLKMQETLGPVRGVDGIPEPAEWPYEGVYRVRRSIPIGYRVGGTSICASALLAAPGLADDAPRAAAVERARAFVVAAIGNEAMAYPYPPRYDVRGWGYAYGLDFLLRLSAIDAVPEAAKAATDTAIDFYLQGIVTTELDRGGWNYAQRPNSDAAAPFMTAPVLRALFHAVERGHDVPTEIIERGLDSLEAARLPTNALVYSGRANDRTRDTVAGATGRMLSAEAVLALAGRGDLDRVRNALDRFFEHWDWLEVRRRQTGTHVPPHGIAPYYFFYAHHAAALAIEQLPDAEQAGYRGRLIDRLAFVREDDGSWNDRVFPRSANYGTAMTMLALRMPETAHVHGWTADDPEEGAELGAGIGALVGRVIDGDGEAEAVIVGGKEADGDVDGHGGGGGGDDTDGADGR